MCATCMPPSPLRVLFVGNSQTRWSHDVPAMVQELSRSAPATTPRVEADAVVAGGASLERLWNEPSAHAKLAAGGWDWLVCHEIIYSYGGNGARLREYGRRFAAEARQVGAKTLFFATGETEAAKLKVRPMYADALALARECGGRVAGGGMAWLRAWERQPDLDLHHTDRAHPNARGYYLNACVICAALTDRSPVGLDAFTLPVEDARFLQGIAWEQAQADRRAENSPAAR